MNSKAPWKSCSCITRFSISAVRHRLGAELPAAISPGEIGYGGDRTFRTSTNAFAPSHRKLPRQLADHAHHHWRGGAPLASVSAPRVGGTRRIISCCLRPQKRP
jgi:hypothetical protein